MQLLPAIDLLGGRAVRLVQGDFGREQSYGDPLALAEEFAAAGAQWLHVVDLDAARTGEPVNRPTVIAIAARSGVAVQTGGGVRTDADVTELLGAGIRRVVLGTAAVTDSSFLGRCCARFPGAVALGLDYRRRPDGVAEAAVRGWAEGAGRSVGEVLAAVGGAALGVVVVTAIERDGTLSGPDLAGLAEVLDATAVPVMASGGVGSVDDVAALAALRSPHHGRRLAGAIVGKALVDGRVSVKEAMAACAASG
jgi:phosphoribosylformimino-5-aminoimidazole carboxamide ribotide isomerase